MAKKLLFGIIFVLSIIIGVSFFILAFFEKNIWSRKKNICEVDSKDLDYKDNNKDNVIVDENSEDWKEFVL